LDIGEQIDVFLGWSLY